MAYSDLPFSVSNPCSISRAVDDILSLKSGVVVSLNPEICLELTEDHGKKWSVFSQSVKYVFPDGIGVVFAEKIVFGRRLTKVAGVDVFEALLAGIFSEGRSCYLIGASEEVVSDLAGKVDRQWPGILKGYRNGFFDVGGVDPIAKGVIGSGAEYVFVAMGCPRQEEFIQRCVELGSEAVFFGVGGSFDVVSGHVKRAPALYVSLGLEWFYRLINQPARWRRQSRILIFLAKVVRERFCKGVK